MGRTKNKGEIWGKVLTDKGYMRVPRVLRLKRAELGISNNEYAILLDYLDYYTYSGGQNPYRHLAQVNGVSERTVKTTLGKLAGKGLIGRIVKNAPSGRTKGVVFSIEPLLHKLGGRVKQTSPTGMRKPSPLILEKMVIRRRVKKTALQETELLKKRGQRKRCFLLRMKFQRTYLGTHFGKQESVMGTEAGGRGERFTAMPGKE